MRKYIALLTALAVILLPLSVSASTLGVNQGGTGSTTLTGILFGNALGPVRTLIVGSGLTLTGTTLSTAAGGGTVTQVNTTYPITGGPITTTGTLVLAFGTTTANTWSLLQSFSNATSTLFSAGTLWDTGVTSALHLANSAGLVTAYTGSSCTAQFPRSTDASGVWTCAKVALGTDTSGSFVSSIVTPQGNTSSAVTFATSSQTTNGLTVGLNIVGGVSVTFNPTISGTLNLAGGGTNASLSGANQLLFLNSGNTAVTSNSLHTYLAAQGSLLLGTTTTQYGAFTIGSSTVPQILLSDNAPGDNMWSFRSVGNYFFVATSTATATSSKSAFYLDSNGFVYDSSVASPAGSFLASDPTGKIIATSSPTGTNYWTLSGNNIYNNNNSGLGLVSVGTTSFPYTFSVQDNSYTTSATSSTWKTGGSYMIVGCFTGYIYAWGGGGGGGAAGSDGGAGAYASTTVTNLCNTPLYVASGGKPGSTSAGGIGGGGYQSGGGGALVSAEGGGGGGGSSAYGTTIAAGGGGGGGGSTTSSAAGSVTSGSGGAGANSSNGGGGGGGASGTAGTTATTGTGGTGGTGGTTMTGTPGAATTAQGGGGPSSAGSSGNGNGPTGGTGGVGSGGAASGADGTGTNSGGGGAGGANGGTPGGGAGGNGAGTGTGGNGEIVLSGTISTENTPPFAVYASSSSNPVLSVDTSSNVIIQGFSFIVQSTLYLFEKIDQYGHLITGGPTPIVSSCGTSPTISGNDRNGTISTSGTVTTCTITFANAYTTAPECFFDISIPAHTMNISAISSSALTMTFDSTIGTAKIYYVCQSHQ